MKELHTMLALFETFVVQWRLIGSGWAVEIASDIFFGGYLKQLGYSHIANTEEKLKAIIENANLKNAQSVYRF